LDLSLIDTPLDVGGTCADACLSHYSVMTR